ncbi:hypothetical protein CSUI_008629 [Cystoisospora suis]|uniref:Uncharacterized protein n=1 Tax=Cystoisospora suis TaxID=483139 RepID=A0A2C6KMD5_9APIC|nr:hypothetical protein CSUI_008629 [Cystoisospora suis]
MNGRADYSVRGSSSNRSVHLTHTSGRAPTREERIQNSTEDRVSTRVFSASILCRCILVFVKRGRQNACLGLFPSFLLHRTSLSLSLHHGSTSLVERITLVFFCLLVSERMFRI